MYRSASRPSAVWLATAVRRSEPEARIGTPRCSAMTGACVPFPAPGAPRRTTTVIGRGRARPERAPSANESFVVAHQELRLDLLHRLDDHADDDQEARPAEGDRLERRKDQ